jgi:hypothetical protein
MRSGSGFWKGQKSELKMGGSNELSSDRLADGTIPVERRSTGISPVEVRQWGRDRGTERPKIGIEMRIQWIAPDRLTDLYLWNAAVPQVSPVEVRQPLSRSGFWTRAAIGIEMEDPWIKLRLTSWDGTYTRGTPSGISPCGSEAVMRSRSRFWNKSREPALAYDKRLNNELKQHTRTVRAC